jgi:hypothetical protein
MKLSLKITEALIREVRKDLDRAHPYAAERVGFLIGRCTRSRSGIIIFGSRYESVPDAGYVEDHSVGAMMNQRTITAAMQIAYSEKVPIFHVHTHFGKGKPKFSGIDLRENAKFVRAFINVCPEYPHGALVLSDTDMSGLCWLPGSSKPRRIDQFTVVGSCLRKTL